MVDLLSQIEEITDYNDRNNHFGENLKVWVSSCKVYLIRYYTHFMGVDIGDSKNYHVVLNNGLCEPVSRHGSLEAAIRAFRKHQKEESHV
jgi:hypothetical protein